MGVGIDVALPHSVPLTIGHYQVLEVLGEGGMGKVFLARDPLAGSRLVAIKTLSLSHELSGSSRDVRVARLRQEAKALGRIRHPAIPTLYHVIEIESTFHIVMEYVEGQSLVEVLRESHSLPRGEAIRIALCVLDALGAAHAAGLVHRDIKPSNVMLTPSGDVKLIDFGLVKEPEGKTNLTRPGSGPGTPGYKAPEQISGREATPATDLFCLGIMLYEMLVGCMPFEGATSSEVDARILYEPPKDIRAADPSIPLAMAAVVMRALEKEPSRRFDSAQAMRRAIEDARDALSLTSARSRCPTVTVADMTDGVLPGGAASEHLADIVPEVPAPPPEGIPTPGEGELPVEPGSAEKRSVGSCPPRLPTMTVAEVLVEQATVARAPRRRSIRIALGAALAASAILVAGIALLRGGHQDHRGAAGIAGTPEPPQDSQPVVKGDNVPPDHDVKVADAPSSRLAFAPPPRDDIPPGLPSTEPRVPGKPDDATQQPAPDLQKKAGDTALADTKKTLDDLIYGTIAPPIPVKPPVENDPLRDLCGKIAAAARCKGVKVALLDNAVKVQGVVFDDAQKREIEADAALLATQVPGCELRLDLSIGPAEVRRLIEKALTDAGMAGIKATLRSNRIYLECDDPLTGEEIANAEKIARSYCKQVSVQLEKRE